MNRTYQFIIELKRPSYKSINWISQLMLLLSLAAFSFVFFQGLVQPKIIFSIVGIIAWWTFCFWQSKNGKIVYYRIGLLFACLGWFFIQNGNWIALIFLIAAILEKQAKFPQEIAFDNDEIVFNTFPKKKYNWTDFNNIIIKDGIITIDFKNNKLLQKEIQSGANAQDEQDFNEFCNSRLHTIS
ncbi:MAG: hypothetical protein NT153_12315 [Bacteroidetes bacterium]|nr:hypothetical protein [Bacteroidota bacterium]